MRHNKPRIVPIRSDDSKGLRSHSAIRINKDNTVPRIGPFDFCRTTVVDLPGCVDSMTEVDKKSETSPGRNFRMEKTQMDSVLSGLASCRKPITAFCGNNLVYQY
jgi:hypothetical protein